MPELWESLFQEMTSKLMLKLKDVEKKGERIREKKVILGSRNTIRQLFHWVREGGAWRQVVKSKGRKVIGARLQRAPNASR